MNRRNDYIPIQIITPSKKIKINLKELWSYRELLIFFSWRDIKVKYKDTTMGVLWVVLQPLALTALFTMIFSNKLQTYAGKLPYPVFVLSGLILWQFVSGSLTVAANSMELNAKIIKKIYFPRLIIPLSALLNSAFDLLFGLLLLLVTCLFWEVRIEWANILLALPISVFLLSVACLGLACLLSMLNVIFKDFKYIIPFFLQVLFFTSPVFYDANSFGDGWWAEFFSWNPFSAAIQVFRRGISTAELTWNVVVKPLVSATLIFVGGLIVFRKTEKNIADLI